MYKIGDKVWYNPLGYGIIIQCSIIEVESYEGGNTFYWIDEPIGHSLLEDEFEELTYDTIYEGGDTLEEFRLSRAKFILSTWKNAGVPQEELDVDKFLSQFPQKLYGVEWFKD